MSCLRKTCERNTQKEITQHKSCRWMWSRVYHVLQYFIFSYSQYMYLFIYLFLHEILQTSTPHKLSPVPFGPHPFDLQGFRQRTGHVLLSCPRKVTTNLNSLLTTAIVNVPSFIYSAPYCQAY